MPLLKAAIRGLGGKGTKQLQAALKPNVELEKRRKWSAEEKIAYMRNKYLGKSGSVHGAFKERMKRRWKTAFIYKKYKAGRRDAVKFTKKHKRFFK